MKALDRKLLRDLGRMKGQVVAVSLVMACGLAMMIMTRSLILTLETTRSTYYQRYAMADIFATLKRAPLSVADRLTTLPGRPADGNGPRRNRRRAASVRCPRMAGRRS